MMELLVASSIGLGIVAMSLVTLTSERNLYKHEVVRTKVNQNLRAAVDIIGMNVREAGEALPDYFPSIQLTDGGTGNDELIIRRNLFENEIFNLCQNVAAASYTPSFLVALNTTASGCVYSSAYSTFLTTWQNYRVQQGGSIPAYLYDRSNHRGEYFNFLGGSDGSSQIKLSRDSGAWANTYVGNGQTVAIYILEEFRFRVNNGLLQVLKNGDTANPLNIVDKITSFKVSFLMVDGTTQTTFGTGDDWTDIRRIDITLAGSSTFAQQAITSAVTVQLFPRNILSH